MRLLLINISNGYQPMLPCWIVFANWHINLSEFFGHREAAAAKKAGRHGRRLTNRKKYKHDVWIFLYYIALLRQGNAPHPLRARRRGF
jgi:hypothetical protein